jgi:hypothetical protein
LLTELRAASYEQPTAERKRKKKAAAVKRRFKRLRSQMLPKSSTDSGVAAVPIEWSGGIQPVAAQRAPSRKTRSFRTSRQGRIHYARCANPLEEAVPSGYLCLMHVWCVRRSPRRRFSIFNAFR